MLQKLPLERNSIQQTILGMKNELILHPKRRTETLPN